MGTITHQRIKDFKGVLTQMWCYKGDQYQIQNSAREGLHLPLSFNLTCSLKKRLLVLEIAPRSVCVFCLALDLKDDAGWRWHLQAEVTSVQIQRPSCAGPSTAGEELP